MDKEKQETIELTSFCESVRDGTHDSPKFYDEGKYLVTSKNIHNNNIDFSQANKISIEDYININKRSKVDKWDLLMTMIGTVGRLYVVKEEPDYAIKNVALFKIGDEWRAKYLYYYLSSQPVQDCFNAVANGTSQHFVGLGYLRKFRIKNISEESIKIVEVLDKYDALIENNNRRIKLLENMAEEIYKEWFVRFRFPEYEKANFKDGIPNEWQYKKFNEIFKYIRGVSYSSEEIESDDGIDFVNLKNIQSYGGFRRDGLKKYNGKYKEEQKVKYHDLVMGVTDMTQERRTVGAVALIPKIEGVITMDLIKLVSEIDNTFWYCLFKYGYYSQMISQFGNGANVIHLRPESIKNQKILLPSKEIIDKFIKIINPIFDEIEDLYLSIENLVSQRDLLLPRLMSGKIDLTDKEIV